MTKRIATNSMIATAKRCKEKFALRYCDGLVKAKIAKAPSFGTLFHNLARGLWTAQNFSYADTIAQWREELISNAYANYQQVNSLFGIEDEGIVNSVEQQCSEISELAIELFKFYRDTVWIHERDRYEPVFVEQTFEVPLLDRAGKRHKTWRFSGKWDLVLRDKANALVRIRDYKTTARMPADFAAQAEIDTQGIGYVYASHYLGNYDIPKVNADFPDWPVGVNYISGFDLEIIRKKIPKEPPLLKKGGLSKAQNIDTTFELYRQAIDRHGLNPDDYSEVLDRLQRRGNLDCFVLRHGVSIGPEEIRRWARETILVLEDVRRVELNRQASYRADPMTCKNQYGRWCEYHSICYGDAEAAKADFVFQAPHSELREEGPKNDGRENDW